MEHLADEAAVDHVPYGQVVRVPSPVVKHADGQVRLTRASCDAVRLLDGDAEGLLDDHVLSRIQALQRGLLVERVRQDHHDQVEVPIGQHLLGAGGVELQVGALPPCHSHSPTVDVAHRNRPQAGHLVQPPVVVAAHVEVRPVPEQAAPDRLLVGIGSRGPCDGAGDQLAKRGCPPCLRSVPVGEIRHPPAPVLAHVDDRMVFVPEAGVREHRAPARVEALQLVQFIEDLEVRDTPRDVVVAVQDPDREFMMSRMAQELAVQHLQVRAAPAEAVGRRMNAHEPAAGLHELQ